MVCIQLAGVRSRDDRCALLLSLLSDAEHLTSCINSLLHIDERRLAQMVDVDDKSVSSSKNHDLVVVKLCQRICVLLLPLLVVFVWFSPTNTTPQALNIVLSKV